ncbi:MAG TPA: DHCW motif cupin fold protein [Kofleriaceae bacterium]|nr:DHCW motif cupin fold protein [Kofleriaceae bacterium]
MPNASIPFHVIDWSAVAPTEHPGETGMAWWQTVQYPGLRMRIVEYSAGYLADHWCRKGHIVHCLVGEFVSELDAGQAFTLKQGMTYVVSDEVGAHRSFTEQGVKLMIIDGAFLAPAPA